MSFNLTSPMSHSHFQPEALSAMRAPRSHVPAQSQSDEHRMGTMLFHLTGDRAFIAADQFYTTTFTTLNGSGVTGEAIVGYDLQTNSLTVAISASGLEPDIAHPQHIHGFLDGTDADTPTLAQDTDGDGYIELAEGLSTYGGILLSLTADETNNLGGDNGHAADGALAGFPTAPDGTIWFVETYQLPEGMLSTDPMLAIREIVLHGMTVPEGAGAGTSGEVDGTAGYKAVLPVASGELREVSTFTDLRTFVQQTHFDQDAAAFQGNMHMGHMHDSLFGA